MFLCLSKSVSPGMVRGERGFVECCCESCIVLRAGSDPVGGKVKAPSAFYEKNPVSSVWAAVKATVPGVRTLLLFFFFAC